MNNTSLINQSKFKNSKVSFDISQIHGQTVNYSEKDSIQNVSGLGTKFTYTDPLSQAYLNKVKKKPQIDKADFHASRYELPIVETDVTQVIENTWRGKKEVISTNKNLNATANVPSLRKQEKIINRIRNEQKLEKSRLQYIQQANEQLSISQAYDLAIPPSNQYTESLINNMNQARENMQNAEIKHSTLLEENIGLKKQISLLKEGIDLQNIRFKYYIQSAHNTLNCDSVFLLDQRIFHILVKSLLNDLEPQKQNFNSKVLVNFEQVMAKVTQSSKVLQNLISENETLLKFLDHDLQLENFSNHIPTETLEQIQSNEIGQQEKIIKTFNQIFSEKILEIEKYRIADNNSRQLINTLSAKSEEYERHLQRIMLNQEKENLTGNLKRILEQKKEIDQLISENESLKMTIEQYQDSHLSVINENNYLSEKMIVYGKKILQLLLDTNMSEQAVKSQMDELLQKDNIDFYLKKRNMEFIKEKYSEHNDTKKVNIQQEQDIDNLQQQLELANQTIDQLEKKLIDETKSKQTSQIPALINLDDTSQLQHTIQQLSLILLSKDNAVQVDQTTQKLIKQMFSENFDQMVEFQQETIDTLKLKLNEVEQKYYQSENKRIEYLNISFYLSNLLTEIIDSQKDNNIRGRLQKERAQIMAFYGKSVQDFSDLIKLQNPKNILPVNQWYVNKLKNQKSGEQDKGQKGGEEQEKNQDDNILSDLTILQQMGVKALQEYISMRINRVHEENEQLKEKMKNIKKDNVTVAELKKQRLLDEERYERLSRKLQAFCQDNIFSASENTDLIGHFNEDFMLSLFIQANTIEEMINKTLENDEDDTNSRPSLSKESQIQKQEDNFQRDSDVRNNQPPILNHSIIEEKPGEEDEYIENGKRGMKVRKSFRNLSNSHHSQDSNHLREESGQGFDQKIQINISISSPDKSHSSSFSGQIQQPIIEQQILRAPYQEESQYYQKKSALTSQKQFEEDLNHNKQYISNGGYQMYDTDSLQSRSSAYQSSTGNTQVEDEQKQQYQQKQFQQNQNKPAATESYQQLSTQYQQQPQQNQQQQYTIQKLQLQQQQQSYSQTPSFKNTPKSTNNNSLQNVQQINSPQQQIYQNNKQIVDTEEYEPRLTKPSQYIHQDKIVYNNVEERQRSNQSSKHSSIHKAQEQIENSKQNNIQEIVEEQQRLQQIQRQKEIQDLKRFSTQSAIQFAVDPTFKKRGSDSQIVNFNSNQNEINQNFLQAPTQQNVQQSQMSNSQHRNQLSISRNSQDQQKLFQETIGQISDIKPAQNKMTDDDNKTSFNEDHFDMLFGQRNNESIDNPYDHHTDEEGGFINKISEQNEDQNRYYQNKNKNKYHNDDDEEYEEDRESDFNNYEPNYEEHENQDQSHQYQEEDDDDDDDQGEEQDDSLEQEAPYFNQE